MDLALSEEQHMIVAMVRQFVREEIVPLEDQLDPDADELPQDDYDRLVQKVKDMGMYGLDTPPEYGGPISIWSRVVSLPLSAASTALASMPRVITSSAVPAKHSYSKPPRSKKKSISIRCFAARKKCFSVYPSLREAATRHAPSKLVLCAMATIGC